jgi:hypothetical protein
MRVLIFALASVLFLTNLAEAANSDLPAPGSVPGKDAASEKSGSAFVVGISPFLDSTNKDTVYRGLVRLIVEDLPLDSKLEVYDAFNLKSITRISIPAAKVFNSPKTRANQFALPIGEIRQFLARNNPKPTGSNAAFDAAIRLPQFCDFLAQDRPPREGDGRLPLLLIGSPLYQDAREPAFSMVDGYFPSDGNLIVSRDQSVFGFNPGEDSGQGLLVSWALFGDAWVSDLHREKVTRFWALYLERRGSRLASFSEDLATALGAFGSQAPGRSAGANGWVADPLQTKPEMLRVTRNVDLVDWLTGDALPDSNPPPPTQMVGPLKIGIRWKENIDLDLYAKPRRDAETLFFQHPRSPEGYYFKDHRSSPGREYEYIEFESPVDVRHVRGYVNFYAGSCPDGPRGEVRIEFRNRIYRGTFAIASPEGNQGRSGTGQADFWTQIPIQEILRLNEAASRADNADR